MSKSPYQHLVDRGLSHPSKVAIITEMNQLSFADLVNMVEVIADRVTKLGVRENDTVLCFTGRGELEVLMNFLSSRLGLTIVHAPPSEAYQAEVDYDFYFGVEADAFAPKEKTILISADWFRDLDSTRLNFVPDVKAKKGHQVTLSSGSTGKPKFVRLSDNGRRHKVASYLAKGSPNNPQHERLNVTPADRLLCTLSPTVAWSMNANVGALCLGASVVVLSNHADRVIQYVDTYRVSVLLTTPLAIRQITESEIRFGRLSALKFALIGGARIQPELLERFLTQFNVAARIAYGTSELGGLTTKEVFPGEKMVEGYLGEINRQDVDIGFFDPNTKTLSDSNEGILGIRPHDPALLPEYLGNRVAEKSDPVQIDGYYLTGDIIRREGNSLYMIGRSKNTISVGGNVISLQVIEARLESNFPGCEFVCIAINNRTELDDLVGFCKASTVPDKEAVNVVLGAIHRRMKIKEVVQVNAWPKTSTGKIDVQRLRQEYDAETNQA